MNKYLIGGLLLAAVALSLQQWRISVAKSKADHYQQRAETLNANYNQAQQVISTLNGELAEQRQAQSALSTQLAHLQQTAQAKQTQLTKAINHDSTLNQWASQPLPAGAVQLLQ
ncbi:hypothetical protein [Celerinatantimonas sp. MCCC 1A17872]|uniref:hypothetical protein n=1 Tax=Celerinatantimonas sp. MCCC 1A17872 TaxID=3177514 RepID=UPI0038C73864